jgi:hypothetical protein
LHRLGPTNTHVKYLTCKTGCTQILPPPCKTLHPALWRKGGKQTLHTSPTMHLLIWIPFTKCSLDSPVHQHSTAKHWRTESPSSPGDSFGMPGHRSAGGMLCQQVVSAASPGKLRHSYQRAQQPVITIRDSALDCSLWVVRYCIIWASKHLGNATKHVAEAPPNSSTTQ